MQDRLSLNAEVFLQLVDDMVIKKLTKCALSHNGKLSGTYDEKSFLILMVYGPEFHDGKMKQYAANNISTNILK